MFNPKNYSMYFNDHIHKFGSEVERENISSVL
jgi:hypothetical protein